MIPKLKKFLRYIYGKISNFVNIYNFKNKRICRDCHYYNCYYGYCINKVCFKVIGFDAINGETLERIKNCYDLNHNGRCLYYEDKYYRDY
jgi:hypothetical protein